MAKSVATTLTVLQWLRQQPWPAVTLCATFLLKFREIFGFQRVFQNCVLGHYGIRLQDNVK